MAGQVRGYTNNSTPGLIPNCDQIVAAGFLRIIRVVDALRIQKLGPRLTSAVRAATRRLIRMLGGNHSRFRIGNQHLLRLRLECLRFGGGRPRDGAVQHRTESNPVTNKHPYQLAVNGTIASSVITSGVK